MSCLTQDLNTAAIKFKEKHISVTLCFHDYDNNIIMILYDDDDNDLFLSASDVSGLVKQNLCKQNKGRKSNKSKTIYSRQI